MGRIELVEYTPESLHVEAVASWTPEELRTPSSQRPTPIVWELGVGSWELGFRSLPPYFRAITGTNF
jgi:hypothetical protein